MKCGQHLFFHQLLVQVVQFRAANCKINGTVQIFNPINVLHEMLTVACLFFSLPMCVTAHVLQRRLRVGQGKNKSHMATASYFLNGAEKSCKVLAVQGRQ